MKVLKKKKVYKMKTTAVTTPTSQQLPPVAFTPQVYKSLIGQICVFVRESITNTPKTTLARIVSQPPQAPTRVLVNTDGSVDLTNYVAFCKGARVEPRIFRVCQNQDENAYKHYVAYCKWVGVEPHTIEYWDAPRIKAQLRSFKGSNGTLGKDVEPNYKKEEQDRGFQVCTAPNGDPACWTRPIEHPITFDKHLARAAYRPTLQDVNNIELTPYEYRNRCKITSIVNRKRKDPAATTPKASLWCVTCCEYVEQAHECSPKMVTCFAGPGGVYPLEQKSRQLLVADKQRRAQEWLQRVSEFNATTPTVHKAAWVESLKGETPYVERSTFSDDLVVVRSFSACDLQVRIVDNLRFASLDPCTPHSNTHYGLREFTFTTGETIRMCRCTKFDEERYEVLKVGHVATATPGAIALHDALLKTFNLSMEKGMFNKSLLWGSVSHLAGTVEELSTSYSQRVNTAGCVGTDHDGERNDSSSRDRRGKSWFKYQQTKEPNTKSLCRYCGAHIYDRAGTHHCPDTDCRQRFWDEWDAGLRMELFHVAEHDDLLMRLWLDIEKNRS